MAERDSDFVAKKQQILSKKKLDSLISQISR